MVVSEIKWCLVHVHDYLHLFITVFLIGIKEGNTDQQKSPKFWDYSRDAFPIIM